jgi:hypothetical protein
MALIPPILSKLVRITGTTYVFDRSVDSMYIS